MISKPLLIRESKANWKVLLIFIGVISLYGSVIVAMYDPKLGESLNMMAESMPGLFEAFGMSNPGANLLEFVGNYLYGFILVVFPMIFLILLSHRLVGRYVDRGSMAYLLATHNPRSKIIMTQAITLILATLILVAYATLLVIVEGKLMFDEGIDIPVFLLVNVGLFGLLLFFASLNFLSSCLFQEARLAIGVGSGLSIAFVLIQMLSQVSDKVEALKYLTPMTLFQVKDIISGSEGAMLGVGVLYGLSIVMFIAAILIFKRKDLSL